MAGENSSIATADSGGSGFSLGFHPSTQAFGLIGSAITDLFGASAAKQSAAGDAAEAQSYGIAASLERQKAQFDKASGELQQYQTERNNYLGMSAQKAAIGGAGMANSGDAIYLAMDSANQANLAVGTVKAQTGINIYEDNQQAASYDQMQIAANAAAAAAQEQSKGDTISGIVSAVGAAALLLL